MNKKYSARAILLFSIATSLLLVGCGRSAEADVSTSGGTVLPPDSADGTVRHVVDGILQHEPQRVWVALPASYQDDVSGVITAFAEKVDADIYDRGFVLLNQIGKLLEGKKELFLASQMIPEAMDREEMAAGWDEFANVIQTVASSDIARLETLHSLDMERFLGTTGTSLLATFDRMAAAAGEDMFKELRNLKVEVLESEEDRALLRVAGPDHLEEMELTRVEGRWVPAEMARDWSEGIAGAREQIAAISPQDLQEMKPQIFAAYGMVEGTIAQLEAAQTPEQLDQALQGIVAAAMVMMMGAAMQGM